MKKINQSEVIQAILNEALTIKRKKELFKEAKKINKELKQLNEYGHPGAMLGYGFKDYEGPSPVLGLATQSNYEEVKPEGEDCGCELDEFPKLEKDIEDFGGDEDTAIEATDDIQSLKDENEELKAKLAQIQDAIGALNEGMFDKLRAGWQGMKAGVKTGIEAGKEAGQQQYQQTQQVQAIENKKRQLVSQLNQAKAMGVKKGEINWPEIQKILASSGYKYAGGAIQPLAEGEEMGLEEGFGGFMKGMFNKAGGDVAGATKNVAGKVSGAVGNVAGKIGGAAQNVAGKVGQYASDVKAAGQAASAQQDQASAEKANAQAVEKERVSGIAAQYDKVINLISQIN